MAWDKEAGRADHGDGTLADHFGFMIPANSRSTWDKNTLTSSFFDFNRNGNRQPFGSKWTAAASELRKANCPTSIGMSFLKILFIIFKYN